MNKIKINRVKLYDKYMAWVNQVSDDIPEKTHFDVDEIINAIIRILEQESDLVTSYQKEISEDTSDGYHTFKELYEFRKVYNAALFNEWTKLYSDYDVHKSWKHNDGELCFGGGWFIVVAILPDGQISNHYKAEDWDLFQIPEVEKAKYEFDGHTSADTIKRLKNINKTELF
jgi:hypothetical protein